MRTLPARELKRRGITAVDEAVQHGPVHIIRNDVPTYVIMLEADYQDLVEDHNEAELARVRESLADVAAGRVKQSTAEELIAELGLDT